MANPIVLIPARMASTRLPGKPLADICGEPMIVHVWRRATEAGVGPVVVAADDRRIVAAVEAAGGRAVMTRSDHQSGSDRIFEALGAVDPAGAHDVVVNLQGDLPTIERAAVQRLPRPAGRRGRRHRHARDADHAGRGEGRSQRRQGGRNRDRAAAAEGALLHPRPRALGRGRAFASHRPLRLSPRGARALRRRCRPRRSSGASGSSSSGRSRPACASTSRSSTRRRSASTRRRPRAREGNARRESADDLRVSLCSWW